MKYVKKKIPIEAILWNGTNFDQIANFMGDNHPIINSQNELIISTLEGDMRAPVGAYIIKGVKGEFYPCDGEIFEETYEPYKDENYIHNVKCNYCEEKFQTQPELFYDSIHNIYKYTTVCPRCKKRIEWGVN